MLLTQKYRTLASVSLSLIMSAGYDFGETVLAFRDRSCATFVVV
jgi:hypothetical protein